jgi:hypothetical protein
MTKKPLRTRANVTGAKALKDAIARVAAVDAAFEDRGLPPRRPVPSLPKLRFLEKEMPPDVPPPRRKESSG